MITTLLLTTATAEGNNGIVAPIAAPAPVVTTVVVATDTDAPIAAPSAPY